MDHFEVLKQFSEASELPVSVFEQRELVFKGHGEKRDFNIPMFLVESLPEELPGIWISHTPENLFFGGFFFGGRGYLILLGPSSANECSIAQCRQILGALGYRTKDAGTFQKIINDFAFCDFCHMKKYLRFLDCIFNGRTVEDIPGIELKWKKIFIGSEDYPMELPENEEKQEEDEERIMNAMIRYGKVEELKRYFDESMFRTNTSADKLSVNSSVRRSYVVGANMVMSRIAISEGVDVQQARNLSGYYLDLLMRTESVPDLDRIFYRFALDYTNRIRSANEIRGGDMLSRRVNSFVQAHLYTRLSTAVIAEALHLNESYLSAEFRRANGKTVTGHIQECKVREAKFLLETGRSPQEISDMLAFSSPSYFGAVFKKITGMTPVEYRSFAERGGIRQTDE